MIRLSLLPVLLTLSACAAGGERVSSTHASAPGARSAAEGRWSGPRGDDWLDWRGPNQDGVSRERGLPDRVAIGGENHLWSYPLKGRGTPVVAAGRVYAMGYRGEGESLREGIVCLDERDGKLLWERFWRDGPTDTVYSRYSISSPTIDPENGNVYFRSAGGLLMCATRDGEPLWERSLVEEYGQLTFPNGRVGAPLLVGDLLIVHIISVTWGPLGPARDRFHAFDRKTGECVWISTPGETPIDNSFSFPAVANRGGRLVIYAETGCGHLVALDARSGDPLWRYRMATGAANASPVVVGEDRLVMIHGGENLDSSSQGRMVCVRLPDDPAPGPKGPVEVGPEAELWRQEILAFSSSPVVAEGRVYQTDEDGVLHCVDLETGKHLWEKKLAADQVHASPLFADGKLYVPMNNGSFWILRPGTDGPEVLCEVQLEGNCLAAPAVSHGRVYVHSTGALYCFGRPDAGRRDVAYVDVRTAPGEPGAATRLQVVPFDVTVHAGETVPLRVRALDARGRTVREVPVQELSFEAPPFVTVSGSGDRATLTPKSQSVATVKVAAGSLTGSMRLRAVPTLPYHEDFEGFTLDVEKKDGMAAYPPGGWFGGRPKWDVREQDGSKVLARVMDVPLFQRTLSLIGSPDDHDYTIQVDLMSDGNRRSMSNAGVMHQRYLIELKGNHQELEVKCNDECLKVSTPYRWKPGVWYSLKTRVDVADDGSGVVRAKVWPRGEAEPAAWTLEVPHTDAHTHGAAGLFGFTLQSRYKVYLDNLHITPVSN
jgi:outer membrane protein assembly factor BamB